MSGFLIVEVAGILKMWNSDEDVKFCGSKKVLLSFDKLKQ